MSVISFGGYSAARERKMQPSNLEICLAGDSRTAPATDSSTGRFYLEGRHPLAWAIPMAGNNCQLHQAAQYGVGGDTTAMLLARWGAVLADQASVIGLLIGTNNFGSANLSLQKSIDDVTEMILRAKRAGKVIALANELPRVAPSGISGQQLQNLLDYHAWLTTAPDLFSNVYGWNTWDAISDFSVGAQSLDGLHQNTAGGFALAPGLADVLLRIFGACDLSRPVTSVDDTLNANPRMAGDTGSKGSGVTGKLAANYSCTISGSMTGVSVDCEKEPDGDEEWQVFRITGTPGGTVGAITLRPTTDLTLAAGAIYDVRSRIRVEPGAVNLLTATPEARIDGSATIQTRAVDGYAAPDVVPQAGYDLNLWTPPATVPGSGVTTIRGQVVMTIGAAGTPVDATVKVKTMGVRLAV